MRPAGMMRARGQAAATGHHAHKPDGTNGKIPSPSFPVARVIPSHARWKRDNVSVHAASDRSASLHARCSTYTSRAARTSHTPDSSSISL